MIPEIRSSDFERTRERPGRTAVYCAVYHDLDPTSLRGAARRIGPAQAWTWAFRRRWRVVELPEPLWLRALPLTMSVGVAVRLAGLLHARRPIVVTYAMENNDPARLLRGLPRPLRRLFLVLLRVLCGFVYDRFAFGSDDARRCYKEAMILPQRCAAAVFADVLAPCMEEVDVGKRRLFAFVAALEERKGITPLLEAWALAGLADLGWELHIAGAGPLGPRVAEVAAHDPSVRFCGSIDRAEVHSLLAEATVVVLPSRPDGRWKEQIGLPIVEGLAHGCRVVATPDTGLAQRLAADGHVVLPPQFTVENLAQALRTACADGPTPAAIRASLPAVAGRIAGEDWMYAV